MDSNQNIPTFTRFLMFFPEVDLPVVLAEDTAFEVSKLNEPLPEVLVNYFLPYEKGNYDEELTEFVPIFRMKDTSKFVGLVYWKASLLTYEFIFATFDNVGRLIKSKVLAATVSDNKQIVSSAAIINEDWTISGAAGDMPEEEGTFDPLSSRVFKMTITEDGDIIEDI